VECPECATTRSLDGPLGDSTIPFPTKNEKLELDFRNPYPKSSYSYRFTSDSTRDKLSSMSNASTRQLAKENRNKKS
jgi:hypothetical protein